VYIFFENLHEYLRILDFLRSFWQEQISLTSRDCLFFMFDSFRAGLVKTGYEEGYSSG
jgi:hypothetical protein